MLEVYVDGSTTQIAYTEGDSYAITMPAWAILPDFTPQPQPVTTNEGEYLAIIHALQYNIEMGVAWLRINSDSQLVVRQLTGEYEIKKPNLQLLACEVLRLLPFFEEVQFVWVPREENKAGWLLEGRRPK